MQPAMSDVCKAVESPSGLQLLRLLEAVYAGACSMEQQQSTPPEIIEQAVDLGLLNNCRGRLSFSPPGYLVGNIAKEYCHWVDSNRHMPPPRPPEELYAGKDVLDLGCSFGRWMWEFQKLATSTLGVEFQQEYIELGRALAAQEKTPVPKIIHGSAEDLDQLVPDNSVDFVFARLVFNHVRIRSTLRKVAAVLRNGGVIWVQVDSLSASVRRSLKASGGSKLRNKAWIAFSVFNTVLYTMTGRQLELKVKGRMHSVHKPAYPSVRSWRAALLAEGFRDFRLVETGASSTFWATKA